MKVLGLDLSTSTGYSLFMDEELVLYNLLTAPQVQTLWSLEDFLFVDRAQAIAIQVSAVIKEHQPDHIIIEQTNLGKDRGAQKLLEFIHYATLEIIHEHGLIDKVHYVDTSTWRSFLGIKLSKEQRAHNKDVKQGKARGKLTWKHLSVNYVNDTFKLNLKLKDNDMADAICLGHFGSIFYKKQSKINTEIDFEKEFGLT